MGSPFSKASFLKITFPGEKGLVVDTPSTAVDFGLSIVSRLDMIHPLVMMCTYEIPLYMKYALQFIGNTQGNENSPNMSF